MFLAEIDNPLGLHRPIALKPWFEGWPYSLDSVWPGDTEEVAPR